MKKLPIKAKSVFHLTLVLVSVAITHRSIAADPTQSNTNCPCPKETATSSTKRSASSSLREVSHALKKAQSQIDEYGTLQVSAPVLTYAKSNDFRFNLQYGATNYFNDAKTSVQGRAAGFEQTFQSFILQAKAEMDPTAIAAYAEALKGYQQQSSLHSLQQNALLTAAQLDLQASLANAATNTSVTTSNQAVAQAYRNFAQSVYGTNGSPAFPTAQSSNTSLDSAPTNLFGLATDTNYGRLLGFLPFLALTTNQPTDLKVPNRTAIITAAGDNAVESIFRTLGDSSVDGNFANKEKFFGLTMVSVDPGWRTQKDWAGEVVVFAELEFRTARQEVVRRLVKNGEALGLSPETIVRIANDRGIPLEGENAKKVITSVNNILTNTEAKIVTGQDPKTALQILNEAKTNIEQLSQISVSSSSIPSSFRLTDEQLDNITNESTKTSFNRPISVMIVSPITDNDTLDLASSYRKQTETALALSFALRYAGAKGEASAFEKFARSRQFDVATRTPMTAVNAFSGQGGVYGFQIGPRVRALEDPASRKSGAANILERQSFPALVLLGTSTEDLRPRIRINGTNLVVYEPYIALRQMRRWIPMKRKFFSGRDWYLPQDWFHPRLSESERLSTVHLLEQARQNVSNLGWTGKAFGWTNDPSATLLQRLDYYEEQLVGSIDRITLPAERIVPEPDAPALRVAQITNVNPARMSLEKENGTIKPGTHTFILLGNNLDVLNRNSIKSLSTNISDLKVKLADKEALVVEATITNAENPLIFSFELNTNKAPAGVVLSPAVSVAVKDAQILVPRVEVIAPASVELKRNDKGEILAATSQTFVLLGAGLKQVDVNANVEIVTGKAQHLKTTAIGDGLKINLNIIDGNHPVTMKLPLINRTDSILSLPISVTVQAPKKTEAQTLRVEKADAKSGAASIAVTVLTNAEPHALEAAKEVIVSEQEKEKPGLLLKGQHVQENDKNPSPSPK